MSEIIDFPVPEEVSEAIGDGASAEVDAAEQISQSSFIENFLDNLNEATGNSFGGFEDLAVFLTMEDEKFEIFGPILVQELQKELTKPQTVASFAQIMQTSGVDVNELGATFADLCDQMDIELKGTISQKKIDFLKEIFGTAINAVSNASNILQEVVNIPIEIIGDAKCPVYAHVSDSGADIYALEDIEIKPGETKLIPTGLKVAIPLGYELQVRPKSGRALKTKLRVANTPGTIDAGYRDEIGVIIDNIESPIANIEYDFDDTGLPIIKSILHGKSYTIGAGEKFCQLVLAKVARANYYQVESISEEGDRGGGFGSTGLN